MKRLIVTVALAAAFSAHASDGVIEINHAKIMANGGYPYVISQPGSYRLTSNLIQRDRDITVLQVGVDGVTIDLNGFVIKGPNQCGPQGGTLGCTALGAGRGIDGNNYSGVVIKNGSIIGTGSLCIQGGVDTAWGRVEDVTVAHCGESGIFAGGYVISRSMANLCNGYGFYAESVVASRVTRTLYGLKVNANATNNVSNFNYHDGIAGGFGVAAGNESRGNLGIGLDWLGIQTGNRLHGNTVDLGVNGFSLPPNSNLCGTSPC